MECAVLEVRPECREGMGTLEVREPKVLKAQLVLMELRENLGLKERMAKPEQVHRAQRYILFLTYNHLNR